MNQEISEIEERQVGASYSKLLKELLHQTQQYRGMANSRLSGIDFFQSEFQQKQEEILNIIREIEQYDKEICNGIHTTMLEEVVQKWQSMHDSNYPISEKELLKELNELNEMIISFMIKIGDESHVYHVKTDYTLHLVRNVFSTLPTLTNQLGKLRSKGVAVIANGELNSEDNIDILSNLAVVEHLMKDLEHDKEYMTLNESSVNRRMVNTMEKVIDDVNYFQLYVEDNFLKESQTEDTAIDFYKLATSTINQAFVLYDLETIELINLLEEQIKKLKRNVIIMVIFTIIAISLTIYCFIGFYYSIRYRVDEVATKSNMLLYRYIFFPQINKVKSQYMLTAQKLDETKKSFSKKLLSVQEEERKRLSRELHDGIGQSLYSILILLNIIDSELDGKGSENLQNAKEITATTMKDINRIARSLRPSILDDLGFILALKSHIKDFKKLTNLQVDLEIRGTTKRLQPEYETALFRVCQEALTNIQRHSKASVVKICIHFLEQDIYLLIQDNGDGFSIDDYNKDYFKTGIGLFSMKERIEAIGGEINVSSKIGKGTKIEIRLSLK